MTDKVSKGRAHNQDGSKNPCAKLIEGDIPRMKDMYACGAMQDEIASWFNVTAATVSRAVNGKLWAHVG